MLKLLVVLMKLLFLALRSNDGRCNVQATAWCRFSFIYCNFIIIIYYIYLLSNCFYHTIIVHWLDMDRSEM